MAYLNGKRIGLNAHVICDTDASYAAGREAGYAEGQTIGYNQGEAAGYAEGQKSMAVMATTTGDPAVCEYVHPTEHEMKVQLSSRNLLPYPYFHGTRTVNGITFTDNGDGTITANGTATGIAEFGMRYNTPLTTFNDGENIYIGGCPAGGSASTYSVLVSQTGHRDTGGGTYINGCKSTYLIHLKVVIQSGTVCDNLVFKPYVSRVGRIYDTWTPYITDFSGFSVQTTSTEGDVKTYMANADGSVEGVKSMSPSVTLSADSGAIITAEYWLDAESKIADMETALLDLGGSL